MICLINFKGLVYSLRLIFIQGTINLWLGIEISQRQTFANLKANKMMSKGLLCHLLSVNDLDHDIPSIVLEYVVNEFLDVFPQDLPGVPPLRDIDFFIDLKPNTKPISIPSYRMALAELKELKLQFKRSPL